MPIRCSRRIAERDEKLAPVTSPLVGEAKAASGRRSKCTKNAMRSIAMSRAPRASREGGIAPQNQTNTPLPIPPPQGGREQNTARSERYVGPPPSGGLPRHLTNGFSSATHGPLADTCREQHRDGRPAVPVVRRLLADLRPDADSQSDARLVLHAGRLFRREHARQEPRELLARGADQWRGDGGHRRNHRAFPVAASRR